MLDSALLERVTRTLALMLRHQPELFDLELDAHGYGDAEDVVRALEERLGVHLSVEELGEALRSTDRVRYELVDGRIRALYGHSIPIEAGPAAKPPERLYVGLSAADAERALRQGLRGGRRRFLHLSATPEEAADAARRAGRDWAVLAVRSLDGWEEGVSFYDRQSLWLTEHIPGVLLEPHAHGDDGTDPRPHERTGDRRDDRRDDRRERHERHDRHGGRGGYGGGGHGGGGYGQGNRERMPEHAPVGDAPPSEGVAAPAGDGHAQPAGQFDEQRGRRRRGGRGRGRDDGGRGNGGHHGGGNYGGGHHGGAQHGGAQHGGGQHGGGQHGGGQPGGGQRGGGYHGGGHHGSDGAPREQHADRPYDRQPERQHAPAAAHTPAPPPAPPAAPARREPPPTSNTDFGLGIFDPGAKQPPRAAAPVEPPRREPPPPPRAPAPPVDDGGGFGAGI